MAIHCYYYYYRASFFLVLLLLTLSFIIWFVLHGRLYDVIKMYIPSTAILSGQPGRTVFPANKISSDRSRALVLQIPAGMLLCGVKCQKSRGQPSIFDASYALQSFLTEL